MDEERSPVEQALDLLVYAPIGFALEAKDMIPKLVERGRGQVAMARLAGRFAAQRGEQEARKVVGGLLGDDTSTSRSERAEATAPEYPFDGYDELTAVEIINRLESLSEDSLETLIAYEEHHRRRSTIINRVRQLQT